MDCGSVQLVQHWEVGWSTVLLMPRRRRDEIKECYRVSVSGGTSGNDGNEVAARIHSGAFMP